MDLQEGDRKSVAYTPFFLFRRLAMMVTIVFLASYGGV